MATPATIRVTELDFDSIKNNLKSFLSSKDEFKDFNYEASGMSFLLDLLAYNTHYNAVLANFVANEMFLDTAAKRSSVISHAKSLGYKARGIQSSRAKIDLTINALTLSNGATAPDTFVLPRGTVFLSNVGNTQFQFVTLNDHSAPKEVDNTYVLNDLEVVEGVYFTYEYLVTDETVGIRYQVPNRNVDESSIKMSIRTNASFDTYETWNSTSEILTLDENSKVFFVQENKDGYYELHFGNGQIGKLPELGNIITIEYVTSNGRTSNGARRFVPLSKLAHEGNGNIIASNYRVTLVEASIGGADPETMQEIKHNASNHFITQNRAVTVNDYKSLIQENFANIRSIKVWGGEDNIPARYGKVMVCIQPQYGDIITQEEKDYISNILTAKSIISVGLEFADPEYINIMVSTIAYYNPNFLPKSINLPTSIANVIQSYSDYQLEKFSAHFRFSKFVADIDATHEVINSSTTTVQIYKTIIPKLGTRQSYTVNFYNKIANSLNSVTSTQFKIFESDQWLTLHNIDTKVYAVYTNTAGKLVQVAEVGSVNFTKGIVSLNSLLFTSVYGSEFRVIAQPNYDDIESGLNNILRIKPEDVSIKTVSELPTAKRNLVG